MSENTENSTTTTITTTEVTGTPVENQSQTVETTSTVESVSQEESSGSVSNSEPSVEDEEFDETAITCIDNLPRVPWDNLEQFIATLISDALKDGYEEVNIRGAKPLPRCIRDKLETKGFHVLEEDHEDPIEKEEGEESSDENDEDTEEEETEVYWIITISWGEYDDENELFWEEDVWDDDDYLE